MDAKRLLEAIRADLRERILPALDGDFERSVVVAAVGILREVAPRIVEDDRWAEDSVAELAGAVGEARRALAPLGEVAPRIGDLVAAAETAPTRSEARRCLLEAAAVAIRACWQDPRIRESAASVFGELRRALAADLNRQLGTSGVASASRRD